MTDNVENLPNDKGIKIKSGSDLKNEALNKLKQARVNDFKQQIEGIVKELVEAEKIVKRLNAKLADKLEEYEGDISDLS